MGNNRADRRASGQRGKRFSAYGVVRNSIPVGNERAVKKPTLTWTEGTRIVFRLEHPESGMGPFTHQPSGGGFASDGMYNLNVPSDIATNWVGGDLHFAFDTIYSLEAGVMSYMTLRQFGINIAIYEVDTCLIYPDKQIGFNKKEARLKSTHAIADFPFEDYV